MAHTVTVGEFEGPLGILLGLVEQRKFEVTSISIAGITAGYLDHVRTLETNSPDDLSEFLRLGARLLYIKSLALLPHPDASEQAEELHQLNLELDEYRRMQTAAKLLATRSNNQTWTRRSSEPALSSSELPLPSVTINQLTVAFEQALRRLPAEPAPGIIRPVISLEAVMAKLRRRLHAGFELAQLLGDCSSRMEIVVTFLALLELIREGAAQITQPGQFTSIRVEAGHA